MCFSWDAQRVKALTLHNWGTARVLHAISCFMKRLKQGWGTYLLSEAARLVDYWWRAAKSINFILKFYLYLNMRKKE